MVRYRLDIHGYVYLRQQKKYIKKLMGHKIFLSMALTCKTELLSPGKVIKNSPSQHRGFD